MNWPLLISILGLVLSLAAFLHSYSVTIATQRAFVSIKQFQAFMLAGDLVVMPLWQNSGGTPTRAMRNHANWKYFLGIVPENFNFKDLGADGLPDNGTNNIPMFIAPKGEQFTETLKIPTAIIESIRKGEGQILVWGWTEYNDVFPFTRRHRTEFANILEITTISIGDDKQVTAGLSFKQYHKHNCADEDCN